MCGEKFFCPNRILWDNGSPPHVRGKDAVKRHSACGLGITPACAGKSGLSAFAQFRTWDHPRMCGEKGFCIRCIVHMVGSPPHVRGKATLVLLSSPPFGITPACAGKRYVSSLYVSLKRDHPRMCGEKLPVPGKQGYILGSPPHVRGKGVVHVFVPEELRITPACAGKS